MYAFGGRDKTEKHGNGEEDEEKERGIGWW
jgi:hypothetical protein